MSPRYTDIDPLFGTLADADELIAAAHGHGLKVIFDLVPNHSGLAGRSAVALFKHIRHYRAPAPLFYCREINVPSCNR